jgi:hypothetical protein
MYTCVICSKLFKFQSSLSRHKDVHKSDFKVYCSCGSSFTRTDSLKRHQLKCIIIKTDITDNKCMDVPATNEHIKPGENMQLDASFNAGSMATIKRKQEIYTQTEPQSKPTTLHCENDELSNDDSSNAGEKIEKIKLLERLKKNQKLRSQTQNSKKPNSDDDDDSVSDASNSEASNDSEMRLPKRGIKKRIVAKPKQKVNLHRLVKREIAKLRNSNDNLKNLSMKPYTSSFYTGSFGRNALNSTFRPSIYGKSGPLSSYQSTIPQSSFPMRCK